MNKCNSCGTQQGLCWINYSESVKRKRNWESEFLAKKGIVKDNDFQLCSPCQTEVKEFKVVEVVKELSQKNLTDIECFPPNYLKLSNFTAKGAQKVQRAITENIKRYSGEWKIVLTRLLNSNREYYHDWNGDYKNNQLEILIHQSAKVEYGEDQFLKREENKMYLQEYFPSEQWTEIKGALKEAEERVKKEEPRPRILSFRVTLTIIIIISVVFLLTLYLILEKKKAKSIK